MGRAESAELGGVPRFTSACMSWIFICLLAATACALPQSHQTILPAERTSNAIPEAEQDTLETLSKSRKLETEPYPYAQLAEDGPAKRPRLAGSLNGTFVLSLSETSTASLVSSTTSELYATVTDRTTSEYPSSDGTSETTTDSEPEDATIRITTSPPPESEISLATETTPTGELPFTTTEEVVSTTLVEEPDITEPGEEKLISTQVTAQPTEKPTEQTTEKPTEQTTEKPMEQPTEKPTEQPTMATTKMAITTTMTTEMTGATTMKTTDTTTTTTTTTVTLAGTPTTATVTSTQPRSSSSSPSVSTFTSEAYSSVSTWQDEVSESTTDAISPTVSSEDVTLFIRIVFEGTWHDVCSKLPVLRQSLADLVNNKMEKKITPGQIVFHQTQCTDNLMPKALMSEMPLTSLLVYLVDENGNFDEKLTKILPSLYEMAPFDFPLTIRSFDLVQESDSGNVIAVVIVSCVAFICLILLAGLLFIMRKRQGRFNYGERCRPVSLDAYSLDSVSAYNSVRRSKVLLRASKRSYGNPTFEDSSTIPSHPLDFSGLVRMSEDEVAIAEEFASIPQVSSRIDELPAGAELKNRYANVIPLPESRVALQRMNNDPLTEYINASYVRGPKNASKYYIACQAPTEDTVSDFWRMLWEQQCKVIIMLTDLVENGVEKCAEYIPPLEVSDCHRLYGDFQVSLRRREAKEKYAISTLHLKNLANNTFREISHIWYLWPGNGVPQDAASLIAVLLEARALQRGAVGPVLVHCSPGTGRTGTVIALDLCIRQYEVTRTVDVPRVVYSIRRDRAGAVQTREQYSFVYKGLKLYAGKLANGATESA